MPTLFYRDSITLDGNLFTTAGANVPAPIDGTVVLIGRECKLVSLPHSFNNDANTIHSYTILADTFDTSGAVGTSAAKSASIAFPGASITIYANTITTPLSVDVSGVSGRPGVAGKAGATGKLVGPPKVGTDPKVGPGGNGGPGGAGGDGGSGGNVVIRYASAAAAPTASALGAMGGPGGAGGKGGVGNPPGKAGPEGAHGAPGKAGTVSITQVAAGNVFTGLETDWLNTWSDYRTQVGAYLYRLFDSASLVQAQAEFTAALQLNLANTTAQTLLTRLVQQETPSGISRDLDMAPDYGELSVSLLGETQLVLSEFMNLQNTATQAEIAQAHLISCNSQRRNYRIV